VTAATERQQARMREIVEAYRGRSMQETADYLGIGKTTVHKYLKAAGLRARKVGRYRIGQVPETMADGDLGLAVPAVGLSDFELHAASMYEPLATISTRKTADRRNQETGRD
jgi:excisionase family DNA binding protein